MAAVTLWLQQSDNSMSKLVLPPSRNARIVKQRNGDWYILWYVNGSRQRKKFGLNAIKDLELRQKWADRLVGYINQRIELGEKVTENDFPADFVPPPLISTPTYYNQETTTEPTFLSYFDTFIDLKTSEGCSKGWLNKLRTLRNSVSEFAQSMGKRDFSLMDFDRQWAVDYKKWRFQAPREHGINYVAKDFRILKQILEDAEVEGEWPVNPKYKSKHYKIKEITTDKIAFTFEEVKRIFEVQTQDGHEKAKVSFVVACLTGLRFGNWKIKREQVIFRKDGDKERMMLRLLTEKNYETVEIPVHPIAEEILRRYNFEIDAITNQKTNKYLKDIAFKAGLDQEQVMKKSRAGKIVGDIKKQWEEVTTHTARRTFVTIALFEMNLPPQLVMRITGHKTEKQLFEYARIGKERAALLVARMMDGFFKM